MKSIDEEALAVLSDDVGALWCRRVAVLDSPPDSLTFLRDYVHPSVPCIIKNAITSNTGEGAVPLTLTMDEMIHHVGGDTMLTVDVTPDGHGDCIRCVSDIISEDGKRKNRRMFVKPHEQRMTIGKFRDLLRKGQEDASADDGRKINKGDAKDGLAVYPLLEESEKDDDDNSDAEDFFQGCMNPPVVYYSRQNDCLRQEIPQLFSTQLFPATFDFAEEVFGTGPPDAINLWVGNEMSTSSMHKDHYENLFYVCSGQKEFILCPPADNVFLHEGEFPSGTFQPRGRGNGDERSDVTSQSWVVAADSGEDSEVTTKWIEPDVKRYMENTAYSADFPLLSKCHPIKVLVSEGELLYIPALWYHRVTQTCETVGVNYWFDMKFDHPHWCYFNFLQTLQKKNNKTNS